MSTVILLSSSPPRVFAQSPTPIGSSSPLPSTTALVQGRSPSSKKFKSHLSERDGLSTSFTTARHILAEKPGAENAFMSFSGRNKFRLSQEDHVEETTTKNSRRKHLEEDGSVAASVAKPDSRQTTTDTSKTIEEHTLVEHNIPADPVKRSRRLSSEPLLLERAAARRLDWTPQKAASSRQDDEKPIEYSAGLMNGMLSSFTYSDTTKETSTCRVVQAPNPAKRRRVEQTNNSEKHVGKAPQKQPSIKNKLTAAKPTLKKTRSPAKKALTITGLATSNYLGQEEADESPMMQYLTSTQAQLQDTVKDNALETKIQKTKAVAKKLKGSKKTTSKSLLLSPTSALKVYNDQEAIFGSASQLARDESPTFLRETIEAMKQSESFIMSDPFSSPQRTQQVSTENTPQTGISKFRRTRNLWAAAGRDEDNALLHVDTVDLTDTPAVRAAFAGKDVMLQPGTASALSSGPNLSLRGGLSPLTLNRDSAVVDITDINTPCIKQTRSFSSTKADTSPRQSPVRTTGDLENEVSAPEAVVTTKEKPPPKPNYAGLTVRELNKHIKSYGFKAMRKREKMIELLDRCWEEKHGPSKEVTPCETAVVPFGDILSNVHDLSARPEPQTKKARASKAKEVSEGSTKPKPAGNPKQCKQKADGQEIKDGAQTKAKAPRKRRSKVAPVNDDSIVDIDSVWATIPKELRELEAFDDWARPEQKKKSKSQKQSMDTTGPGSQMASTPLATLPTTLPLPNTVEPRESEVSPVTTETKRTPKKTTGTSSETQLSETIASQITAAIMHQSRSLQPERNHNTNPTWHEKLLLYDPIVLEDLAAWLNTEGLGAVGQDREVSALDVREWCEARGICCLWRGGWRGNKSAQS